MIFINMCVSHGTAIPTDSMLEQGEHSMHIYDPIANALGMAPTNFNYDDFILPEDATFGWQGGSEKGRNCGLTGGPTTTGRIFVTDGKSEMIVDPNKIPKGFTKGRLRVCQPLKTVVINCIEYASGKDAAQKLNISQSMVTYLRKKQGKGKPNTKWHYDR